jgi:hypothetical protein
MARSDIFESLRAKGYRVEFHSHARAILLSDFLRPMKELMEVLEGVTIPIEEIIASCARDFSAPITACGSFEVLARQPCTLQICGGQERTGGTIRFSWRATQCKRHRRRSR